MHAAVVSSQIKAAWTKTGQSFESINVTEISVVQQMDPDMPEVVGSAEDGKYTEE